MLMLCDELQCWNRTSYGRNSRRETHPMWCEFKFSDENNEITVDYVFDEDDKEKTKKYDDEYEKKKAPPKPLKAYSDIRHRHDLGTSPLTDDIRKIVALSDETLQIKVKYHFDRVPPDRKTNLSDSNFLHLHNFAIALHVRYNKAIAGEKVTGEDFDINDKKGEEAFAKMSLEYQLSNVAQARNFAEYLYYCDLFYTDRQVTFEMKKEFNEEKEKDKEDLNKIGILQHGHWSGEKKDMGWDADRQYVDFSEKDEDGDEERLGEQFRCHKWLDTEYTELPPVEREKRTEPTKFLTAVIKQFEGLRIYRLK
jgi:hypothetical protein